jgi:hypothetical protein
MSVIDFETFRVEHIERLAAAGKADIEALAHEIKEVQLAYIRNHPDEVCEYVTKLHKMIYDLLEAGANRLPAEAFREYGMGTDFSSTVDHITIPKQRYERMQRVEKVLHKIKEDF